MDLIYTDKNRLDVAVLNGYELDFEIGEENDFQICTHTKNNVIDVGGYFYIENTEYGGRIDKIKVNTSENKLYFSGPTFYGILAKKIICPDVGQDYYTVTGNANEIIANLIERLGLSELFVASTELSGITFTNYKFDRYINCYSGLSKMLKTKSAKLTAKFLNQKVVIGVAPISDYSNDEFSSDSTNFSIEQNKKPVNHLICLGKGDLAERTVIDLFIDNQGNVTETQYFTGLDEIAEVYDYSNVESEDELLKAGVEKLLDYQESDSIQITIESSEKDVGDIVGGEEVITKLKVTGVITKKIVKIRNNGMPQFTYEVGN